MQGYIICIVHGKTVADGCRWLYAAVATLLVGGSGILSKAANPRQDTDAF